MKNLLTLKNTLLLFSILLLGNNIKAQVGFNNPNPDVSSVVDIKATDKGILIPRLTTAERAVLLTKNPANGLMIYDIDENRLYFHYLPTHKWIAANPWQSTGDSLEFYTLIPAKIGVGTNTPKSKFSIAGNSAIGGTYAGTNGAPANGLIVEGNVGVGVTNPSTKLQVNGTITATNYGLTAAGNNGPVPQGLIAMWSGVSAPTGWALCDGTNGTPDLRERFIVGAGNNGNGGDGVNGYSLNNTGGVNTKTLTTNELPSHNHTGTTNTDGAHSHTGQETHRADNDDNDTPGDYIGPGQGYPYYQTFAGSITSVGSDHAHNFTTNTTGSGNSFDIRPTYYALAFIMKL